MNRRDFIRQAGLAGLSLSLPRGLWAAAGDPAAGKQPDIVILLAADMGYSDIGCFGGEIETPNLDALAANGVRFTQFYNVACRDPSKRRDRAPGWPSDRCPAHLPGGFRRGLSGRAGGQCESSAGRHFPAAGLCGPTAGTEELPRPGA